MATPDIQLLKLQLNDGEENLKKWTKVAENNHDRLVRELVASDAQDSRKVIECSKEITRIKTVLERKLAYSRNKFESIDPFHVIRRFETGNLDYTIFKDRENVERLVRAYESMDKKNLSKDPEVHPHSGLHEKIYHVAALICAGWCKLPSDSPYWKVEKQWRAPTSPERIIADTPKSPKYEGNPLWYSPSGPEYHDEDIVFTTNSPPWFPDSPNHSGFPQSPIYHPSSPQYSFPRPEPGMHNVPSSLDSWNTFIPTPTTSASLNNNNKRQHRELSGEEGMDSIHHRRHDTQFWAGPASGSEDPEKRIAVQDSSNSYSGWGGQAQASNVDTGYAVSWEAANPVTTVPAPSGGWAAYAGQPRTRQTSTHRHGYATTWGALSDINGRSFIDGPPASVNDNSMDPALELPPRPDTPYNMESLKYSPTSPDGDAPTSPRFSWFAKARPTYKISNGW